MTTIRLLFLSPDADAASRCLHVDDQGRVLGEASLDPAAPAPALFVGATRTVVVVPGTEARVAWLDVPARSAAQAAAAARVLLADAFAWSGALHLAIESPVVARARQPATAGAGGSPRLVVAVEPEVMRAWLARAAAFGMPAMAVVPEQLLLPAPDPGSVRVVDAGDRWIVRGDGLAFSAEPALAEHIIAGRPCEAVSVATFERGHSGAFDPEVDLLQGDFAPASPGRDAHGSRRLAWLALAVLASPLLLGSVQALRLELAARQLEARADALVRPLRNGATTDLAPTDLLRAELDTANGAGAFADAAGSLFAAVAGVDGARLQALEQRRGDVLRATLTHADAAGLETVRATLASDGWNLVEGGSTAADPGMRTTIALERTP